MVAGLPDNGGAYFFIDRDQGSALTLTLWTSEAAALKSDETADKSRGSLPRHTRLTMSKLFLALEPFLGRASDSEHDVISVRPVAARYSETTAGASLQTTAPLAAARAIALTASRTPVSYSSSSGKSDPAGAMRAPIAFCASP